MQFRGGTFPSRIIRSRNFLHGPAVFVPVLILSCPFLPIDSYCDL